MTVRHIQSDPSCPWFEEGSGLATDILVELPCVDAAAHIVTIQAAVATSEKMKQITTKIKNISPRSNSVRREELPRSRKPSFQSIASANASTLKAKHRLSEKLLKANMDDKATTSQEKLKVNMSKGELTKDALPRLNKPFLPSNERSTLQFAKLSFSLHTFAVAECRLERMEMKDDYVPLLVIPTIEKPPLVRVCWL